MNIEQEYEKLYTHWFKEVNQLSLTELTQDLFNIYNNLIDTIIDYELLTEDAIEQEIFKRYQKAFTFLFEDLLEIRKRKIINASLSLQEIDLKLLYEAEKSLYQNIIASVKGFEKLKRLSTLSSKGILSDPMQTQVSEQNIPKERFSLGSDKGSELSHAIPTEKQVPQKNEILEEIQEEINYKLIRFLEDNSAIVGMDLLNYGPFKSEDIAYLPDKNAEILVNEKIAQYISIN
ncbi:MAG: hypothetical protein BAJALOKI1v1_930005 [Promethearchaeota archaeon]|nr:MAG: hypothetical protein BAJALOKI1v1_930005 [Candidatus Lokiarchaeota archaeon]